MSDNDLCPEVIAMERLAEKIESGSILSDEQRDALDKITEALGGL